MDSANNLGGVSTGGQTPQMNSVQRAQMQGPDPAFLAAERARMQQGAQMGNQGNAALAGYMMS